jgi:hypothetical protein
MVNAICQTRGAPLRTTTSMFSLFILGLFQLLTNSLTIMHVVTQYTAFSSAGFPKPLGTGPVRPVTGGTGPTWYTNRPGSHPKPCLSFFNPTEPAGFTGLPSGFFCSWEPVFPRFGEPCWSVPFVKCYVAYLFLLSIGFCFFKKNRLVF